MNTEQNKETMTISPITVNNIIGLLNEANGTGRYLYLQIEEADIFHIFRIISAKYPWLKSERGMPPEKDKTKIILYTTSNITPVMTISANTSLTSFYVK